MYENEKSSFFRVIPRKSIRIKIKKKNSKNGGRCWGVSDEVSFSISLESSTIRLEN